MLVFDASNRDQCEVTRLRTNTPLQALVLLNDPVVLEAARVFAEKLMTENSTVPEKIVYAFRSIACRAPKNEELELLVSYFAEEQKKFEQSPGKAKDFIKAGEFPLEDIQDKVSLAALMQVVHTIYNMEESITKV
jgi:hypothetical protein